MARTLLLLASAPLLLACQSGPLGRTLTLAQVQALNPGVHAAWLLEEYPQGRVEERWPNGQPRRISYPVTDPTGRAERLTLDFNECGIAVAKRYSGRMVRPPGTTLTPCERK